MKFQSIFILFNIILVIFIGVIFFSPPLVQDSVFWKSNWALILVLFLILAAFDSFFFANRKLYTLLEKEDWPALVLYLEDQIYRRGRYSRRLVWLLANTYLVLSDSPGVMGLENKASLVKASLVDDSALVFGTARILGKDIPGAVRFFETRLDKGKPAARPWVRWYFGFALLLDHRHENAAEEFTRLAETSNDGVVAGLSAYFLGNPLVKSLPESKHALKRAAENGRARVLAALPEEKNWNREIARIGVEVFAAVLSKYLKETREWLYGGNHENVSEIREVE